MTAAPAYTYGFTLFDTAIGPCGLAWGPAGVIGAQLPEPSMAASRARLARRFPQAREAPPPPAIAAVRDDIIALLAGEPRDLADILLDMSEVPPFHQRVYAVARAIPPGATFTYGEIAARIGEPGAARAVGQALGRNPFPIIVPCHRVLAAGGRTGGFSARGGVATKMRMLTIEGARLAGAPTLFDADPAFARLGAAERRNPR